MVIVLMENLFICFEFKDSDYVFWDLCRRKTLELVNVKGIYLLLYSILFTTLLFSILHYFTAESGKTYF